MNASPQLGLEFEIQKEELARVESKIGKATLQFCQMKLRQHNYQFHMEELRKHLSGLGIVFAPASPDRVLRSLRAAMVLDYFIVNRRQSLYELIRAGRQ